MKWNRALLSRGPTTEPGACPSAPKRWKGSCPRLQPRLRQSRSCTPPLEARFGMSQQATDIFVVLDDDEKGRARDVDQHLRSNVVRLQHPSQEREYSHGEDRSERHITERQKDHNEDRDHQQNGFRREDYKGP